MVLYGGGETVSNSVSNIEGIFNIVFEGRMYGF